MLIPLIRIISKNLNIDSNMQQK